MANSKIIIVFLLLAFFFFSPLGLAILETQIFKETFGVNTFYRNMTGCYNTTGIYSTDINISNNNYLTTSPVYFDNAWYLSNHDPGYLSNRAVMEKKLQLFNSNISGKYNTIQGLDYLTSTTGCFSGNCYTHLTYLSNKSLILDKNSRITFYYSSNSTSSTSLALGFLDNLGRTKFVLDLDNVAVGSGVYDWTDENGNITYCLLTNITNFNSTLKLFNYTLSDLGNLNNACKQFNKSIQDIQQISFSTIYSTVYDNYHYYIDDIEITFYNGSNELPEVNFSTLKTSLCLNETADTITAYFNISAYDAESDTIYYAVKTGDLINKTTKYTFFNKICSLGFCNYVDNLDILTNFYYKDANTCKINVSGYSDQFSYISAYDINGLPRTMLYLKNTCSGSDKSIYFKLPKDTRIFTTENYIYDLDINETFNITIYDKLYSPLIVFGVENTDTNTLFYNYNATKNLVGNISKLSNFDITLNGFNSNRYGIQIINGTIPASKLSVDNIAAYYVSTDKLATYYSITIDDNSDILLDYIQIGYSVISPSFSTTKPNSIELTQGNNWIALYTTDNIHLTTDYNIDYINIGVYESSLCLDYNQQEVSTNLFEYENTNNYTGATLIINEFLWFIRFPYRFALYFGLLEIFQLAVSMAFIVAMVTMYISSNQRVAGMSITTLFIISFIISIILNYMVLIYLAIPITLAFLSAISLYVQTFKGESNGSL